MSGKTSLCATSAAPTALPPTHRKLQLFVRNYEQIRGNAAKCRMRNCASLDNQQQFAICPYKFIHLLLIYFSHYLPTQSPVRKRKHTPICHFLHNSPLPTATIPHCLPRYTQGNQWCFMTSEMDMRGTGQDYCAKKNRRPERNATDQSIQR